MINSHALNPVLLLLLLLPSAGIFDVARALAIGLKVGQGSDIAAAGCCSPCCCKQRMAVTDSHALKSLLLLLLLLLLLSSAGLFEVARALAIGLKLGLGTDCWRLQPLHAAGAAHGGD
jgi:hypothetical protein